MKKLFFLLISVYCSLLTIQSQPVIQWQKCYGGSMAEMANSIIQTSDSGYLIAGYAQSNDGDVSGIHYTINNYPDYWVVKLNSSGNIQWQKCLGGSDDDRVFSIAEARENGGYIIAGTTYSIDGDITGYHGCADYWVVKLDTSGNIQWQKCLGGSSDDRAYSIKQTPDGGYVVAGATWSYDGDITGLHDTIGLGNCGPDYWVVKLNPSGNIQWQKCLGGNNWDEAYSIDNTFDGGYIVAGRTESTDGDVTGNHGGWDYWIVKLDSLGAIQWQKSLGGSLADKAYSVQQTSDWGYIVAGFAGSSNGDVTIHYGGLGGFDYWVVKLDSTGNLQWQKTLGGSGDDEAYSIWQCVDRGYIVAGYTTSIDYDVSGYHGGTFPHDYWVAKIDSSGTLQWQKCLGGSGQDEAYSIQQTADGCYIVAGVTESIDGDVTNNHGINATSDFWVVKLCYMVSADEIAINNNDVNIYPNPASNKIKVESEKSKIKSLEIYNMQGQVMMSAKYKNQNSIEIDVSGFARGIYLVKIRTDNNVENRKLVIQ